VKHCRVPLRPDGTVAPANDDEDDAPTCIPNAVGRLKSQLALLVGDEMTTRVRNQSLISVTRPVERGYVVDWGTQCTIWRRVTGRPERPVAVAPPPGKRRKKNSAAAAAVVSAPPPPAGNDGECLVVLVQPHAPHSVLDPMDRVIYDDLAVRITWMESI